MSRKRSEGSQVPGATSAERADDASQVDTWSSSRRAVVSGLIAFHVFAVFIAPFAAPPPASELAQAIARMIQPYLKAVAIDNGYRFFAAPDPVPSHLVRYVIELSDGETVEGRFPDTQANWPRLMYHRHFMLAESLFNLAMPVAEIPAGGFESDAESLQFNDDRERADALRYSVARFLMRQHSEAVRVQLFAVEHQIPTPWDLQAGLELDDPELYAETLLGVFTRQDIEGYEQSVSSGPDTTQSQASP